MSYVQCFLYFVSSSINVSIFHNTWLGTFWTNLIDLFVFVILWIIELLNFGRLMLNIRPRNVLAIICSNNFSVLFCFILPLVGFLLPVCLYTLYCTTCFYSAVYFSSVIYFSFSSWRESILIYLQAH